MLKKLAEIIFRDFFKDSLDALEKRISTLESENKVLNTYVVDNKNKLKELEKELMSNKITIVKVDTALKTAIYFNSNNKID